MPNTHNRATVTDYQRQLDWLIKMHQTPGFRDHAKWKAKKMEEGKSGLYRGLALALDSATAAG